MLTGSEGESQRPGPDLINPVQSPLCEEGGAKMSHGNSRPVENLLGKPMILCSMTLRFPSSRYLRHIHDRLKIRFLGCLGEIGCGLQDPGHDRKNKVCSLNALDRCTNRFEIEDVARYDLRAKLMISLARRS